MDKGPPMDKELSNKSKLKKHKSKLVGDTALLPSGQRAVICLLEHHCTELVLGGVIMFNLFLMIEETDARAADLTPPAWIAFMNNMLIFIYSVELCLKVFAYRKKFFTDEWNVVDFLVVGSDVVLLGLEVVIGGMPKVSVFRMFRLVRLMRAFKALSVFPELAMLLRGFVCAAKAIFWGLVLIGVVTTIWSVLAVQLIDPLNKRVASMGFYKDCERCPRAFSTVFQSNLTILQTIIAGDSWGTVAVPIIENFPMAGIFFMLVLTTLGVGIMNLILAVIVDSAQGSKDGSPEQQAARQEKEFELASRTMTELCSSLDTDGGGTLTKAELMAGFQLEEFQKQMQIMSIEESDMSAIFDVLDDDGSGDVSYNELVQQLHRFRSPDMRTTICELTKLHQKVQNLFAYDREENAKNHTFLLSLLKPTGSGEFADDANGGQFELTIGEQLLAPRVPFEAQKKEEKKRERKEGEVQQAPLGTEGFYPAFSQLQADMRQLLQESAEVKKWLSAEKWDVADMSEMLLTEMGQLLQSSAEHHKALVGVRTCFEDAMYPGRPDVLSINSLPDQRFPGESAPPTNSPPIHSGVAQHFPGDLARKFDTRADFDAYCAERSRQRRTREKDDPPAYCFGEV